MDLTLIIAAASGLAIGNSLFFGAYLWGYDKKNGFSNQLLALLLFALAIRISKSVIIIFIPGSSNVLPAIGLVGMAAIGPLLYLYFLSLHAGLSSLRRKDWLHFLPVLLLGFALTMPFVNEEVIYRFYQFVVAQLFVYLAVSLRCHYSGSEETSQSEIRSKWGYILLVSVFLIWSVFFSQLIIDSFLSYLLATGLAAFSLYGIAFWVMKNKVVFKHNSRLEKLNGNTDALYEKIKEAFESRQLYKDHNLTVDKLSEAVKSQSYLVSLVINEKFQKSFPELINSYRIEEARNMLKSGEKNHLSIESIAYESGFNSLSSFYSSFKKQSGTTPAEYRSRFHS